MFALALAPAFAAAAAAAPMDLAALDAAVEACRREDALAVFAGEAQRRSAFVTAAYQEQAAISAERAALAARRRAMRERAMEPGTAKGAAAARPATDDEAALALDQLVLDDRQRALDDARRLEGMRREAIDMKRQYFLTRCPSKKGE